MDPTFHFSINILNTKSFASLFNVVYMNVANLNTADSQILQPLLTIDWVTVVLVYPSVVNRSSGQVVRLWRQQFQL